MADTQLTPVAPPPVHRLLLTVAEGVENKAAEESDDTQLTPKTLQWGLDEFSHCQIMSIGLKIKADGQSGDDVSTRVRAAQQGLEQALQGESGGAKLSINVFFSASEKRTLLNADGSEAEEPLLAEKNHLWTFERDFSFLNADGARRQSYWEIADLK